MRIWDVSPADLCRQHLLGEHRELHGLWNILTIHGGQGGYAQHPETRRWIGKLAALYARHQALVQAMQARSYQHATPLNAALASGTAIQDILLDSLGRQKALLVAKDCQCYGSQSAPELKAD